ncbi:unnamed protein product, partial [Ascophyllum nodosum]
MHQVFLTRRALYLLVWDVTLFHDLDPNNIAKVTHENIMRWLYTLHLRSPGATVILVANKCDSSLAEFEEITKRVEQLVKCELDEWQERRRSNRRSAKDVTTVRLLGSVNRISCKSYGGIEE